MLKLKFFLPEEAEATCTVPNSLCGFKKRSRFWKHFTRECVLFVDEVSIKAIKALKWTELIYFNDLCVTFPTAQVLHFETSVSPHHRI